MNSKGLWLVMICIWWILIFMDEAWNRVLLFFFRMNSCLFRFARLHKKVSVLLKISEFCHTVIYPSSESVHFIFSSEVKTSINIFNSYRKRQNATSHPRKLELRSRICHWQWELRRIEGSNRRERRKRRCPSVCRWQACWLRNASFKHWWLSRWCDRSLVGRKGKNI